MPTDYIQKLEFKIEQTEKLLEEERSALQVLLRLDNTSEMHSIAKDARNSSSSQETSVIRKIQRRFPPDQKTRKDHIKILIKQFGNNEFTAPQIEEGLKVIGQEVTGVNPRSRIVAILGTLEKEGMLERTYSDTGQAPHRFKALEKLLKEI